MTNYADFDRSTFPLITVTFTGTKETPENFKSYLDGLLANYDRKEQFSLVFDASKASTPNPAYQQKQARWMKENESLIKTYCKGVAYVIPNPLLRGVLKFIFAVQKNPVPFKVVAKKEDGIQWAKYLTK